MHRKNFHIIQTFKFRFEVFLVFAIFFFSVVHARSIKVNCVDQFNEKIRILTPGDSIILANGTWKDVQLEFTGIGEKGKYIYLVAETPGKVTIEGKSLLKFSGNWTMILPIIIFSRQSRTEKKKCLML